MSDAARPDPPARPGRSLHDNFALLAECLLVGVYVLIASLPVITVPAALAAGTAHLRRHVTGESTGIGRFARDWWAAVRDLWVLGAAGLALGVLLTINARVAASGMLPGGEIVHWAGLAVGAMSAVVILRVAGRWSLPGDGTPSDDGLAALVPLATRCAREDPAGSLLLLLALGLCGLLVWMLAPLTIVVGGLLSLAIVGVEARHHLVTTGTAD